MGRSPSFEKGLKKGPWMCEEDQKLVAYIKEHGHGSWSTLPLKAGLQRCGKSCRLRWTNYLNPDIKRGKFSWEEEQTIMQLHALLGNKWSTIASHLPMRTDNDIKNYWNTNLRKRLVKMGIDPVTHKSRLAVTTNLSHMTQWEKARLEAEARLVRESRIISKPYQQIQKASTPLIYKSIHQPFLQPQPLWQGIISRQRSDLKVSRPPISTLKFFEKALSSLSIMQNQSMPVTNLIENTNPSSNEDTIIKDCTIDYKILKEPFNIFENTIDVNDIMYQDNYVMEAVPHPSVDNANNGSNGDDFDNNDVYWSHILDKLGNDLSFSFAL